MSRVIVVGAGLAGLTAGYHLHKRGISVTILEARPRVGGRVWSVTLRNGAIAELGGEWISSTDLALIGLATELEVDLDPTIIDFALRDPVAAPPIPRAEHEALFAAIRREAESGEKARSVGELLDRVSGHSSALEVLRSRLAGSAGVELAAIPAHEIDGAFGLGSAEYSRCRLGNQTLANSLAAELEDVRLESPVVAADGRRVFTESGEPIAADAVVVAVPLSILSDIDLDPPLPDAIGDFRMGRAAKMAIPTSASPPLIARQSIDAPIWYWTAAGEDGAVRPVVSGFAGADTGVARALAVWPGAAADAIPEADLIEDPVIIDWTADPWARGCYSALAPGQEDLLELFNRAHGRLVYAGEHTNGSGTMNGAVESGLLAATLIEDLLTTQ